MNTHYIEDLMFVFDALDIHDKTLSAILICFIAVLAIIVIQQFEIEALGKKLNEVISTTNSSFKTNAQCFKTVTQCDRELLQKIVKLSETVEQLSRERMGENQFELEELKEHARVNAAEILGNTVELIEAKERFHRLSKELSLEEFKEKAEEYFEEKIQETYDMVDNAWGDDLMIACEKQNRFKAKLERVREASTNKEVFEAMFAPV